MKKQTTILSLIAIFVIGSLLIFGQNRDGDQGNIPTDQVNRAIETFMHMANDQNIQTFGLKSMEQLHSLKAGRQFRKFMIGLDDVKKFKSGNDVNAIIRSLDAIEVSLVDANRAIQSSIEFTKKDNQWAPSAFGLSSELARVRNIQAQISDSALNTGRLVGIPALKTAFLATGSGAATSFIVLEDNEALGFRKGATIQASEAILKLVDAATQYNGLPD